MSAPGHGSARAPAAALTAAIAALLAAGVLASSGLLASCSPAPGGEWEPEIESLLTAQAEAWNRGDIAGYMEGYWKSDSLLFTSGGTVRRGWRQTYEKYAARYDTREKMGTLKFSQLEYHLTAPGAAWVFGRWELERAADSPGGVFTVVLKKFPGGWKIVHDHTSSDPQ
jgi:ketosteroid isomerase-like protein